jgi:hypothetical protein
MVAAVSLAGMTSHLGIAPTAEVGVHFPMLVKLV